MSKIMHLALRTYFRICGNEFVDIGRYPNAVAKEEDEDNINGHFREGDFTFAQRTGATATAAIAAVLNSASTVQCWRQQHI